jgi:hypothetical protein
VQPTPQKVQTVFVLHALPAEDALVRVVAVERMRVILLVPLRPKRFALVLDLQQLRSVMYAAVAVVVVTDGAIQLVILQNAVHRRDLRLTHALGRRLDLLPVRTFGCARAHELAVDLDDAVSVCTAWPFT